MKALRFYKAGDLRVEDIAEPECGPDQVMVDIQTFSQYQSSRNNR
jgi:NADPH:quinone reductase-like Zn-dependent oxidoreductase